MTETATVESSLRDAAELLQGARRIAVLAHVNPDADAMGAVAGLTLGLRALGKDATGVLADPVPVYARFLPGACDIVQALPPGPFDVYLFADSAGIERVGAPYEDDPSRFEGATILNLDHHRTNPLYGTVNLVDPRASSSAELSYRLLCEMGVHIDAGIANTLLFGIVGDTGSFRNGATTPGSLEVAGRLIEAGADIQQIAFQLFEWKTFSAARLWGRIVGGIELDRRRGIVLAVMTQQMVREECASADETEGVAEYLRGIEEAEVVMLLKEREDGMLRVSMRSRPAVDVSAIAAAFDGGGHRQAAGCTLSPPIDQAKAALVAEFDRLYPR